MTEKKIPKVELIKNWLEKSGYTYKFNLLKQLMEISENGEKKSYDDGYAAKIWYKLELDGYKTSDKQLFKIMRANANEYNPLEDYFKSLPNFFAPGGSEIEKLADTLVLANEEHRSLLYLTLKKWFVGAVRQVLREKEVSQFVFLLQGGQGKGKTTWLDRLCPESLGEEFLFTGHIDPSPSNKDTCDILAEKLVANFDDQLEGTIKKDYNEIKSLITITGVNNRKPYATHAVHRRRVCNFVGSVNNPLFLRDWENRRFAVFSIKDVKFAARDKVSIDKCYAEAIYLMEQGMTQYFNQAELKRLQEHTQQYRIASVAEELVQEYFRTATPGKTSVFMTRTQIQRFLERDSGQKVYAQSLSTALSSLGFFSRSHRIGDKVRKCFELNFAKNMEQKLDLINGQGLGDVQHPANLATDDNNEKTPF